MRNKYVVVVGQLFIVILYPAIENTVTNTINGTDAPPRWEGAGRNSREFEKNQDSNVAATVTSLNKRFNEKNNGSCLIILGTFLCRPLLSIRELIYQTTTAAETRMSPFNEQNNGSARAFRIFIRPICLLKRSTQLRQARVKCKYFFYKASSSASLSSLLKLPNNMKWPNSALLEERNDV